MTNSNHEIVTIEYGVREAEAGGWIPVIVHNGKERWSWQMRGTDRDVAMEIARATAQTEAERYSGDWDVRVWGWS